MKQILVFLSLLPIMTFSQEPTWQFLSGWGTNLNGVEDVVTNMSGEAFAIGSFYGYQEFSDDTIYGASINCSNCSEQQSYVVKLDANGQMVWNLPILSTGHTGAVQINMSSEGYIYALFQYSEYLVNQTFKLFKIDQNGDIISEYSPGGNFLYSNMNIDEFDNIIISSWKNGGALYGDISGPLVVFNLTNDLEESWIYQANSVDGFNTPIFSYFNVEYSEYNSQYIIYGQHGHPASYNGNVIGNSNFESYNFILRLDLNGDFISVNELDFLPRASVSNGENLFLAASSGIYPDIDNKIVCINQNDELVWEKIITSEGPDWVGDITVDMHDKLYFTGNLQNTVGFDNITIGEFESSVFGSYILSFDLDGSLNWIKTGNSLADGYFFIQSLSTINNGSLVVCGNSSSNLNLDGHILNIDGYSQNGFVAKLSGYLPSGCTDYNAVNYNSSALVDDSTCCYQNCGVIEGFVYEDLNNNISYDSIIDSPLPYQIIKIEKSNNDIEYRTCDVNGLYSFVVDTGQQAVTYQPPSSWHVLDDISTYTINVLNDSTYSNLDFGLAPVEVKGDLNIDMYTGVPVCSEYSNIFINIKNIGTESISGIKVELWVNSLSQLETTNQNGSIFGNYVTWIISEDIYPYIYTNQEVILKTKIQLPNFQSMNQTLIDSCRVTPLQPNIIELSNLNNFDKSTNLVLCSYDPNDKLLEPKDCFYHPSDTIDYTIRFQNTGNYPATTVRLVDTLDLEKLDIMTFHVLGASHLYEWSIKPPSVLEVIFNDIALVDSSVSFEDSQGFFKYAVSVRDDLPNMDPTYSPAHIFFDSNPAVITNAPELNFVSNLSADLQSINSSCNGANDGTASLNIASITEPYTIAWNSGDTTTTLSNLSVGTYSVTLTDNKTCVYTDSVSITEPAAIVSSNSQSICNGQSITIGTNSYDTSGTYTEVFSAQNGCDSTVTTHLTVLANTSSNTTLSSCDPVSWNGQTYSSSGNYSFTTTNSNGCDSIANLDLTINNTTSSQTLVTSCDSYSWNGTTYSESGVYTFSTTNINGCDSTAFLSLTVNSTTSSSSTETSCDSYTWNGNTYNSSGTYSWVGANSSGCDSIANLNLTINNSTASNNNLSICFGESVTIGSSTYNQTGIYEDTLIAINGCDSTITTQLTVYSDIVSSISQSGNDITVTTIGGTSPYSYQWNTSEVTQTITPLANGEYWVIITDMNSCESDTAFFTVNWMTSSINEINLNNLAIYPNPSNDVFNIVFNSNTKQDIDLIVHNVLGEVIFSESIKNFNGDFNRGVDLSQHPNAIYILKLNTKDGFINKKLVLEK